MSSLFQNADGSRGNGGAPRNNFLHSFKAGKCTMSGSTVTPQKAKGLVYLKMEDGLMNFFWKDRQTNRVDESIILFPGDAKFLKCKSCTEGRVYYLKFQNNRREFFWMQDKEDTKDTENATKLDDIINGRTPADTSSGNDQAGMSMPVTPGGNAAEMLGIGEEELQALDALPPDEREQMLQMLGLAGIPGMGGDSTPAVTATPAVPPPVRPAGDSASAATPGAASGVPMEFTQDTLRNVMAGVSAAVQAQQAGVSLSDVLSSEQLTPLLADEDFVKAMTPLLPEGQTTVDALRANVTSPQYAQALAAFSAALASEDATAMMGQFGVDPAKVAEGGGGAAGLLHALQAMIDAEGSTDAGAAMDTSE